MHDGHTMYRSWFSPASVRSRRLLLLGITLVFFASKVAAVPTVVPLGSVGGAKPEPRDVAERQVQALGFRYAGDFEATVAPGFPIRLRMYIDPDQHCAAGLMDMTSGPQKISMLEFSTDFLPAGSITTSTSPYMAVLACAPEKMVARVPWKQTVDEVYALHRALCRIATEQHFEAKTVHADAVAENIRESTRRDCEYQVRAGRYRKVAEGQYKMTLWGTVIAVPISWFQTTYGALFWWFRIPDGYYLWKLRRRLRHLRGKQPG